MDLLKLDPVTYKVLAEIEGRSSLIWTERYSTLGDFELRSPLVDYTRELIPEDSLVALRDSREIMIVESHEIEIDNEGIETLVTKGRSFESLFEYRAIFNGYAPEEYSGDLMPETIILLIMINSVRYEIDPVTNRPRWADYIPNHTFEKRFNPHPIPLPRVIEEEWPVLTPGDVYSYVSALANRWGMGFRNIRPIVEDTTYAGILVTELFYGQDRTRNQLLTSPLGSGTLVHTNIPNKPVVFNYDLGHLTSPSYIFSTKDFRNAAYVYLGPGEVVEVRAPGYDTPLLGASRKVLQIDGRSFADANEARQKGLIELAKYNQKIIFDGKVSPDCPFVYNKDYFLGDHVDLDAQYGYLGSMLVSEYIRSENDAGYSAYPTLVSIPEIEAPVVE